MSGKTKQATFGEIASTEPKPGEPTSFEEPETKEEFINCAEEYAVEIASEHFPDLPVETVEWEVSTRAERAAGRTKYNRKTEDITVRLAWAAFEKFGWEKMCRTIRHELIHVWECYEYGDSSHGVRFRSYADDLDVDIHCERFKEPKYWLICEDCEKRDARYKRSKTVKHPERYSCQCGGDILVEETDRA
jgi:SprT-like protein